MSRRPAISAVRGLAPVALLAVALTGGCEKPRKPVIHLHDVEISRVDLKSFDAVFVFDVVNLNDFGVTLKSLEYRMEAPPETFASGESRQAVQVPARGQALVRAPCTVEYGKLLSALVKAHKSGAGFAYELHGRAKFDLMGLELSQPLAHRGTVPAVHAPHWKFVTVRLAKDDTGIDVVFSVTNPNEFALPVVGVRGAIKIEGQPVVEVLRCPVTEVPPGATVELVVPVRLELRTVLLIGSAIARREVPQFEGELKFDAPASLRRMLLGSGG